MQQTGRPWIDHPSAECELCVERVETLGSRLVRITFSGDELRGFRSDGATDHVKLSIGETTERSRHYTVRAHRAEAAELDVDIVLHDAGLVSDWARSARRGDRVVIAGPRRSRLMPDAGRHVLIGDLSALPAIARWLDELPAEASALAIIAVETAADAIPLADDRAEVVWLPTGDAASVARLLPAALPAYAGRLVGAFVWAAGEIDAMRAARATLVDELGLPPSRLELHGYWRLGQAAYHEARIG